MNQLSRHSHIGALVLMLAAVLLASTSAEAQTGTIAPEIERLMASEGIDAAKAKFEEMSKSDSLDLMSELNDLGNLTRKYMMSGNQQAGMAVAEMTQELMRANGMGAMLEASRNPAPQAQSYENYQQKQQEQFAALQKQKEAEDARKKAAEEQRAQERKEAKERERIARLGQPRDDLARFVGMYSPPDKKSRTVFVGISCDGYLVSGPMWADTSNWYMKSTGDTSFTHKNASSAYEVNYKFSGSPGVGMQLEHDIDGVKSPMVSYDSSPDEIPDCIQ